jgi:hypothetical protein
MTPLQRLYDEMDREVAPHRAWLADLLAARQAAVAPLQERLDQLTSGTRQAIEGFDPELPDRPTATPPDEDGADQLYDSARTGRCSSRSTGRTSAPTAAVRSSDGRPGHDRARPHGGRHPAALAPDPDVPAPPAMTDATRLGAPRRCEMEKYESKYRTLRSRPYHRSWHDSPQAKKGLCTVAGVERPHPATRSLLVRDSSGNEVWVAACEDHVPPNA